MKRSRLSIVPCTFRFACAYIAEFHRHHKPPRGMKFAVAVQDAKGKIRGVITAGRPVARSYDDGLTLEVNRSCTDGCKNANSALYGAVWRIAREMGYMRCVTYTQEGESGASLRAVGWIMSATLKPRQSWAASSKKYSHLRDPIGSGGVARLLWMIERKV